MAAPESSQFNGPGGSYGEDTAQAILKHVPSPGNYYQSLQYFLEERRATLARDILEAYHWGGDIVPLKLQQEDLSDAPSSGYSRRMMGLEDGINRRHGTFILSFGKYRGLYQKVQALQIEHEWAPAAEIPGVKLSTSPLMIEKLPDGRYNVHHSAAQDVPTINHYVYQLWDNALNAKSKDVALVYVAEFEWWFFVNNCTYRSGASIGDAMSLSIQIAKGLPVRKASNI